MGICDSGYSEKEMDQDRVFTAGEEIPLCARIMAVADVFDAVSSKRCYRDAMPLKDCFQIIINGRGTDFDPDIVDAFMLSQEIIEEIMKENRSGSHEKTGKDLC